MPKILINASLASSLHVFRGPLIQALVERGFVVNVTAPSFHADDRKKLTELGAAIHEVPLRRVGTGIIADLQYFRALMRVMREIRPDYVLNYTIKPNIWGSFAARLANIPAASMITGLGYAFAPSNGIKQYVVKWLAQALYRQAVQSNFLIFFQNPDDADDFKAANLLAPSTRVCMINGSGVDLSHYEPVPLPDRPVFLMIARLLRAKGIREYAKACEILGKTCPDARFILVGPRDDGPDGISEKDVRELCGGFIEFLGPLNDVRPIIGQSSVYVLPSYREGTPRSSLEAMAMGRAVVTTDAPGCRETVVDGVNGFLVPVKNAAALADAMFELAKNPALRQAMGERSLEIARSRFDVNSVNAIIIKSITRGNETS